MNYAEQDGAPETIQAVGWNAIGAENQALIMDHYRNPRNRAPIEAPDVDATEINPFCGDECTFRARLTGGVLSPVSTEGAGCSICQASLSLMSEAVLGRTPAEALRLSATFTRMMRGESIDDGEKAELGELTGLAAVRTYPVRVKCALLAWWALEQGLSAYAS
ncbi:MAG: SUF system NifU family Fe-S cluster assembly protein [Chloroflexota bacterium]|nr:SUF system NifU family Fe-S cluster assembly protein [Chloroflexota bacterium]